MKIPRRTFGFLLGILATLAAAVAYGLIFRGDYPTTQTARRTFTIDKDFTDVRKILVRYEGAKQIVTISGSSDFISQDLTPTGVEVEDPKLLGTDWRLELHGTLRVRTKDEYIGRHEIDLGQDVEIEPDFLDSHVYLKEPSVRLKQYDMKTHFSRDEPTGKSRVDLELTQEILTDAPWFAHGIADRRVRQSAERALVRQEAAIRKFIAQHIDEVPVFPLR